MPENIRHPYCGLSGRLAGGTISPLVNRDKNNDLTVGSLIYEPKTRSFWHTHPKGQILIILEGEGYYQEKGKPVRILKKGDVVVAPENVAIK